jgi:hypothetical protein
VGAVGAAVAATGTGTGGGALVAAGVVVATGAGKAEVGRAVAWSGPGVAGELSRLVRMTPNTTAWATTSAPTAHNARVIQWARRPGTLNFGKTTF